MDPISILAGSAQIVAFCGATTQVILRYVVDVRTADERIRGFYEEITSLKQTYHEVESCLESPVLRAAAEASYKTDDGKRLWNAVRDALNDSRAIMKKVTEVLDKIHKTRGFAKRPRTQFEESVRKGELGSLRDRLRYFNRNIALSIQMVTVLTSQENKQIGQDTQRDLDIKFHRLEAMMTDVLRRLDSPTAEELRGTTLVVGSVDDYNPQGQNYLDFARRFLTSASAVATERSNLSTISPPIEPSPRYHGGAAGSSPLQRRQTIALWASDVNVSADSPGQTEGAALAEETQALRRAEGRNYRLAESYLKLGPERTKAGNHESAEKIYRSALAILAENDFSGRISYHPAEIVLMLSQACLRQQKYDECIDMLKRVADRSENIFPASCAPTPAVLSAYQADILQSLAACHLLGEVYRQKGNYEEAKDHALKAVDQRTDTLGESDAMTLESVELLIQIYREMGDSETADAYMVFLDVNPSNASVHSTHEDFLSEAPTAITIPEMSPPPSEATSPPPEHPTLVQTRSGWRSKLAGRVSVSSVPDPEIGPKMTRVPTKELRRISTSDSGTKNLDLSSTDFATVCENVRQLVFSGKQSHAAKIGLACLKKYDLNTWPIREAAIRSNLESAKSPGRGLAGTGKGYAAIHLLCEVSGDRYEEVDLLVKEGVDINCGVYKAGFNAGEVFTPLHLAIKQGNTRVAKLLVKQLNIKLDSVDRWNHTPLLAACRRGNTQVVSAVLDKTGSTPKQYPGNWYCNLLIDAARHCDLPLVELLLSRNLFDVNKADKFGKTALMHAIIKGDVQPGRSETHHLGKEQMIRARPAVVRKLLDHGADINLIDIKGNTATAYARLEGDEELVEMVGSARFELPGNVPRHATA